MKTKLDLVLNNVCLRGEPDSTYHIGVNEGKIVAISKSDVGGAEVELDAENNLVTESFVRFLIPLIMGFVIKFFGLMMVGMIILHFFPNLFKGINRE